MSWRCLIGSHIHISHWIPVMSDSKQKIKRSKSSLDCMSYWITFSHFSLDHVSTRHCHICICLITLWRSHFFLFIIIGLPRFIQHWICRLHFKGNFDHKITLFKNNLFDHITITSKRITISLQRDFCWSHFKGNFGSCVLSSFYFGIHGCCRPPWHSLAACCSALWSLPNPCDVLAMLSVRRFLLWPLCILARPGPGHDTRWVCKLDLHWVGRTCWRYACCVVALVAEVGEWGGLWSSRSSCGSERINVWDVWLKKVLFFFVLCVCMSFTFESTIAPRTGFCSSVFV